MAGASFQNLLRGIEAIYADLGDPGPDAEEPALAEPDGLGALLDPAAEAQVEEVLRTLRRIGTAPRNASTLPPPPGVSRGVIGGAALLMRSDFIVGREDQIPGRLPSFVYLTTLIFLGQEEAERRCREVEALVEAEGFGVS